MRPYWRHRPKVETSPPNYSSFCDFLNCFGLSPFNTIHGRCSFDYAIEPYTYHDKRGGTHVIDYLSGSSAVHCFDGSVRRVHDLIADINISDHVPIQAVVSWSASVGSIGRHNRKSVGYGIKKFNDSDCARDFCNLLSNRDPIPVCADVTSHCHVFHTHLYEFMCQAFPKDPITIRADGVSSDHLSIFMKARSAKRDVGRYFPDSVRVGSVLVLAFGLMPLEI